MFMSLFLVLIFVFNSQNTIRAAEELQADIYTPVVEDVFYEQEDNEAIDLTELEKLMNTNLDKESVPEGTSITLDKSLKITETKTNVSVQVNYPDGSTETANVLVLLVRKFKPIKLSDQYKENFIKEIGALSRRYDDEFFSSVTIAQAILESYWGKSELAFYANNFFGFKSDSTWNGPIYSKITTEYVNDELVYQEANMRHYDNVEASVADHAVMLSRTNWFKGHYAEAINAENAYQQADALTKTYATDPSYGKSLVNLIDSYELWYFDNKENNPADYSIYGNEVVEPPVHDSEETQSPDPESDNEQVVVKPTVNWKNYNYFKVTRNTTVYDNRYKPLKPVGKLVAGQEYKIKSDYGKNWHEIQFGNINGYVEKIDTTPSSGKSIKNANAGYKINSGHFLLSKHRVPVYDNSSGKLVSFAYVDGGEKFPIASDYGYWWRVIVANRVGYVAKNQVFLNGNFDWNDYDYFKAKRDTTVYDNRYTPLKPVAKLVAGQEYKIKSNYGKNWHEIQFGNINGYVEKIDTVPSLGKSIKNAYNGNISYIEMNLKAKKDIPVYDYSSKKLVPYGYLNKGTEYPISKNNDKNWWKIVYANRIGYVYKQDVSLKFDWHDFDYFRVTKGTTVYDNRYKPLKPVGELVAGQEYKIKSDYGKNWHEIQFGDINGYVEKIDTMPALGKSIKNANSSYKINSGHFLLSKHRIPVYDNSSGKLVPFAYVDEGEEFPIASDYGYWWRVIVADRVGFVAKNQVFLNGIIDWNDYDYFKVLRNTTVYDNRYTPLKPVGKLVAGQEYKIKRNYGKNWHEIQFGNINAYVEKIDTLPAHGESIKNTNHLFNHNDVISNVRINKTTPVYDNTSGHLVPFAYLRKGTEYNVVQDYGTNWWTVVVANRVGYIGKANVKMNNSRIFIDAGHGGYDSGAVNGNRHEADDNLALAKQLKHDFEKELMNIKLSREEDSGHELSERTDEANEWPADLFISVHRNSAPVESAQGVEAWLHTKYRNKPNSDLVKATKRTLDNFEKLGFKNRGVKYGYTLDPDANLYVNEHSNMPSVLFEVGFISNDYDNYLFTHHLKAISKAIVKGILNK